MVQAMTEQGLSDEEVFGKPKGMSDADVFGAPEPAPDEPISNKGFKQRLSDLWERGKVDPETAMASSPELRMGAHAGNVGEAFKKGFEEGRGGWETLGLSDEQNQQLTDLLGNTPARWAAIPRGALQGTALLFRGMSGLYRGAQEAAVAGGVPKEIAQMPDAFMGSPHPTGIPKPTEAASISRVVADRDGNPRVQHIGELPTHGDFKAGADVLSHTTEIEGRNVEKIKSAAIRANGKVYEGILHSDAKGVAARDLSISTNDVEKLPDFDGNGFVTTTGRFVGRQEADRIVAGGDPYSNERMGKKFEDQPDWMKRSIVQDRQLGLDAQDLPPVEQQTGLSISVPPRAAPTLVEKNLRELWDERGLHPAEVVHDAQSDALLRHDVAPPSFEAFHGSPNDFAEFDVSKTNEGVQLSTSIDRADTYTLGKGTLYKVVVNATIESFIDRGKSIEQQSEPVRKAVADITAELGIDLPRDADGAQFYSVLSRKLGEGVSGIQKANQMLRERGVPGIHDGAETVNVFDDKLLEITEKNGIPFKPTRTMPVQNTPMPQGTPRSELARTGEPHIDAILDDPVTKRNIDHAVINDQYDVPYSAGGSTPMHDPTMFIDRHFPRSMEVDGVRWDPAEPFTIHENVEQHVMEALIKGGTATHFIGTTEPFNLSQLSKMGAGKNERAVFLAPTKALARDYGDITTPVNVEAKNPKTIDWSKREGISESTKKKGLEAWYNEQDMAREIEKARAAGHDVLYIDNIEEQGTRHGLHRQTAVLDPTIIREAGGMDHEMAYRVAHFEFAEKAEGAWYRAHGIDQAKAEEAYRPYIDQIQHQKLTDAIEGSRKPTVQQGQPRLVVARRMPDGSIKYGKPDELHADLIGADEEFKPEDQGFALPGGRFMSRDEAWRYVQENEKVKPGQSEKFPDQLELVEYAGSMSEKQYLEWMRGGGLGALGLKREGLNPPPNLYRDPYPHDDVRAARGEPLAEPGPTKAEIARAKEILAGDGSVPRATESTAKLDRIKAEIDRLAEQRSAKFDEAVAAQQRGDTKGFEKAKAEMQALDKPINDLVKQRREIQPDKVVKLGPDATTGIHEPESKPSPGGADVTRDMPDTPLSVEPLPPAGSVVAAGREAMHKAFGPVFNLKGILDPMATNFGTSDPLHADAMRITKDAMNSVRRIRWNLLRTDKEITRRFDAESQKVQWDRLDEQSVMEQEGKISPHMGLATLEPAERMFVEMLRDQSKASWAHALDTEMIQGDGLPAYAPRMMLNMVLASESKSMSPRALNALGRDVFTKTSQMLHRGYLTAEETEAAGKRLVERRMTEAGASPEEIKKATEQVQIARTIRALPLAAARLEEAAVWKEMVNNLRDVAKRAGNESGTFTIEGHAAFREWKPDLELKQDLAGKPYWEARVDSEGNTIFKPHQIMLPEEFKGPLLAILEKTPATSTLRNIPGLGLLDTPTFYGALMALKGKAMTVILNSPLTHDMVVLSKVMEASAHWGNPAEGFTFLWKGNRIAGDLAHPARANELIEAGLAPMGPRGAIQDITGMVAEPNLTVGHHPSITGKTVGALVDILVEPTLAPKAEAMVAKLGDFVHNDLLWNRVRDLQFGLADYLSDKFMNSHGLDRRSADIVASHISNIVVGSLPKEMMSAAATTIANLAMFSRSYTLGGLSVYKQALVGLPKPLQAQLAAHLGEELRRAVAEGRDPAITPEAAEGKIADVSKALTSKVSWMAWRKAVVTLALSYGLFKIGNALLQSGVNLATKRNDIDEELKGYVRRLDSFMKDSSEKPLLLLNVLGRLSPTWDNEPTKRDRIHIGDDKNGRGVYVRNIFGKYGEEVESVPTGPAATMIAKQNPTMAGLFDVLANNKGFGQHFYDEFEGKESIPGMFGIARDVATHLFMKHMPEQQLRGAFDMLSGEGNQTAAKWRTFGPVIGMSGSEGDPGGPVRAEALDIRNRFNMRFFLQWPSIKKQIERGDVDGARARMTQLGAPPSMQEGFIRNADNPAMSLRGRTLMNIIQFEANPEQRGRVERAQQRSGRPVPAEMEMPQ